MLLSVLWAVMSLSTQSTLRPLPVDVSQVGVVGEMVTKFWERAEWCSRLETSGSMVCNLIPGPMNGQVHLVTRVEEATKQLRVMQDEHEALQSSATRVRGLVLGRSNEMPSLVVALSPSA
jgi:hypothetical protein